MTAVLILCEDHAAERNDAVAVGDGIGHGVSNRALAEYNKALAEMGFRQGTLLEESQVTLITETWRYDD